MLVIGLTGGIGSGKSTVTKLFATLDVPVIDTDVVAREVVIPGSKALNEIQLCFGERYIQSDGHLDRAAMRQLVFADDDARAKLESILHHRIHRSVWNWIEQQQADYCIVVVPLLFEKGWDEYFDRILVVDADEEVQIARTMQRDHLSREEVLAIIHSQIPRQQRNEAADDIIENHLNEIDLEQQVNTLHQNYLKLVKGEM